MDLICCGYIYNPLCTNGKKDSKTDSRTQNLIENQSNRTLEFRYNVLKKAETGNVVDIGYNKIAKPIILAFSITPDLHLSLHQF